MVSDHGAEHGRRRLIANEWLLREGYLVLAEQPAGSIPFAKAKVDWSKTTAWGEGGYYCRLCLNVTGREPNGTAWARGHEPSELS